MFREKGQLIDKTVIYFLGRTITKHITLSHEHASFAWMSYTEAFETLTFPNEQELLTKAHTLLGSDNEHT